MRHLPGNRERPHALVRAVSGRQNELGEDGDGEMIDHDHYMDSVISPAARHKFGRRPMTVDCWECEGHGYLKKTTVDEPSILCSNCAGFGLDAVPWSEMFMDGRSRWQGKMGISR